MSKAGVDVDDVIAEFVPRFISLYNRVFAANHHVNEIRQWDMSTPLTKLRKPGLYKGAIEFFAQTGAYKNLRPVPGALEGVKRLQADHDVYFITARPLAAIHDTYEWFEKHSLPIDKLIFDGDKAWHGKRLGLDVMVDDRVANLDAMRAAGINSVLYNQPWNQTPQNTTRVTYAHPRAYDWDEIVSKVRDEVGRRSDQWRLSGL